MKNLKLTNMKPTPNSLHAQIASALASAQNSSEPWLVETLTMKNGKLNRMRIISGDRWHFISEEGEGQGLVSKMADFQSYRTDWAVEWIYGMGLPQNPCAEGSDSRYLWVSNTLPAVEEYATEEASHCSAYTGTRNSGSCWAAPLEEIMALIIAGKKLPRSREEAVAMWPRKYAEQN